MVAVNDFSGLTSFACAFARAAVRAANDSLDRCTGGLRIQDIKTHRTRSRALCAHPMPDCLLGVLGNEVLELALCSLVVEKSTARIPKQRRELRPGIGRAHVANTDCLDAWAWRCGIDP